MEKRQRKLRSFLKRDIIQFLEEKSPDSDKKTKSLKNHLRHFKESIDEERFAEASDVFEEMIERFNDISPTGVYKELFFNQIYKAFNYAKEEDLEGDIDKYIRYLKENDVLGEEVPNKLEVLKAKKKEERQKEFKQAEEDYDKKNDLDDKIDELTKQVYLALRKENLSKSVNIYKQIKKCFEEYPSRFSEEKEELYNDLLSLYVQIKKLSKQKSSKEESDEDDEEKEKFNPKEFKAKVADTKQKAKRGEFNMAKQEILDLKHMVSSIPSHKEALHAMLDEKIDKLKHGILAAEKMTKGSKKA